MKIIDTIKAVWNKMIGKNDVKRIWGIDSGRSSEMDTAIQLYKNMRSGIPSWCVNGKIRTTRFSNVICREIANLTMFNTNVEITGNEALQKKFDAVMNKLQERQEESCASCGIMVKSTQDGVEFLDPDYFLITDTNTDGDALAAVFFSYIKKGDKYYTKAEYHRFENNEEAERVYHISSKAYKSDRKDQIGTEIPLSKVKEWKDIQPEVLINGLEYPLFVYWKNPFANAIDKESPLTVPVFAECIEELRWLDIALNMFGDETEDSRHVTYVPQTAIEYANSHSIELPRFIQGIEMGTNEDNIKEHVPTLLVTERVAGINFLLSIIGYKCGFSNGYFSFDESRGIQTATQVESDDRRTLHTIESFRTILDGKNHDGVIHRILYILYATGTANGTIPASGYQTACEFEDLVYNLEDDRARWWNYVLQNKVPAWRYFVKFEGMTESEAKAMIEEAEPKEEGLFDKYKDE